ncbi:hypothetical protein OH77DRAFT_1298745 [Trametes cingulata]|nr:hypothetical protein OH77DRAFT_1298745 [Trametes cingulata]
MLRLRPSPCLGPSPLGPIRATHLTCHFVHPDQLHATADGGLASRETTRAGPREQQPPLSVSRARASLPTGLDECRFPRCDSWPSRSRCPEARPVGLAAGPRSRHLSADGAASTMYSGCYLGRRTIPGVRVHRRESPLAHTCCSEWWSEPSFELVAGRFLLVLVTGARESPPLHLSVAAVKRGCMSLCLC